MAGAGSEMPPVFGTVGRAFGSTWQGFLKMPLLFLSAYAGVLAVSFAAQLTGFSAVKAGALVLGRMNPPEASVALGTMFASSALNTLFLAPLAVAMHRFVLRGDVTRGIALPTQRHTGVFIVWLLIILAVRATAYLPAVFGASGGGPAFALPFLYGGIAVVAVMGVRLSLLFPAVAIDAPSAGFFARAAESWARTRGHFWYVFVVALAIGFAVSAPLIMVISAITVGSVVQGIAGGGPPPSPNVMVSMLTSGPLLALNGLQYVVLTATGASGASWIYQALAETSVEAKAETFA